MIVRFRQEGDPTGLVERSKTLDDVRSGGPRLFEERSGDRQAESKLGELLEGTAQSVERGAVRALSDAAEDRQVAVDVEVRPAGAEVEKPEPAEAPRLVKVEVEDDLQGRTPGAPIASR